MSLLRLAKAFAAAALWTLFLLLLLLAVTGIADAQLRNSWDRPADKTAVRAEERAYYRFALATDSDAFAVPSGARVTFGKGYIYGLDTGAEIELYRVTSAPTVMGSILMGALTDECGSYLDLEPGTYWIKVTTRPTGAYAYVEIVGKEK
jgi:hypothetical protein